MSNSETKLGMGVYQSDIAEKRPDRAFGEISARVELQGFLNECAIAMHRLGPYLSASDGYNLPPDELAYMEDSIYEGTGRRIVPPFCDLVQISDEGVVSSHRGKSVDFKQIREGKAIRGAHSSFKLNGHHYECVELDNGNSRQAFLSKTRDERRTMIKAFAIKQKGLEEEVESLDPEELPKGFAVFITRTDNGFHIEELVSFPYWG